MRRRPLSLVLVLLAIGPAPGAVPAQEIGGNEAPRLVTAEDYDRFESLRDLVLSPDGRWLAVTVAREDEDGEVRLRRTDGDSTVVVENGTRAEFSPDGAWLGVRVAPGRAERERIREEGESVRDDLVLLDLVEGRRFKREQTASWSFSPDGRFVTLRRYRSESGGNRGSDMVVRELATGTEVNFGNVGEAEWHDDRPLLAMTVNAEGEVGNGVRTFDAGTGTIRTLHSEEARFSHLAWRDEAFDLAVLRADPDEERGDTVWTILAWQGVDDESPRARRLDGALGAHEDREMRITDHRRLRWAEDGSRLFFAAAERAPVEAEKGQEGEPEEREPEEGEEEGGPEAGDAPEEEEDRPGVEIWHARDVDPVPQQRLRANQVRRSHALAAWDLAAAGAVILGGDGEDESISILSGDDAAVLLDRSPYRAERMFGPDYEDVYVLDVATGERTLVVERIEYYMGQSPGGRHLLYFRDEDFHAHDREEGTTANLTRELEGVFANQEVDRPVVERPSYGIGGWIEGDRAVLLNDRYDVWRVAPDGSGGERLTRGREEEVRHRVLRMDRDERSFDPDEPLYLSLFGEWTKESGFARLNPGGSVERLVYEPRSVGRLERSEDGSTYAYVTQRFDEPPAVRVTNPGFANPGEIVRTNDFLDGFLWGRSELVEYENDWGERLQGALFYPADYEPGRAYPMIVYHYERRSHLLHNWTNPSERSAYNTAVFTQNGYFVLQPDIVYRLRDPGRSAMAAILPAVDAALATGSIDPERIGIIGHSWGGYQTTFAVTQTDRFAAGVAGAPLTNLISMYLSFYWNTGGTDARIFEISQGRMEVPWWEDYEAYVRNSPVHHIQRMNTPLLMAFGTEDGAVDFNQGVEFYNAARRAGKEFVLLVYEGENHSLSRRPNQKDYHRRVLEWFGHYLKGEEALAWITEGVPFVNQEEKLERGPAAGRRPGAVP